MHPSTAIARKLNVGYIPELIILAFPFFYDNFRLRTEFRADQSVSVGTGSAVHLNRKSPLEFETARRFSYISSKTTLSA